VQALLSISQTVSQHKSMGTLVDHYGQFVRYSLRHTKPMQMVKLRCDVVVYTGLEDKSSRCIHDHLETI